VKRPEHLIAAGLVGSALIGSSAVVILWLAGRSGSSDWPIRAALDHPAWLAAGELLGAAAVSIGAASLVALGTLFARSSALATLGAVCLAFAVPGVVLVVALDLSYARAAQNGVLDAIRFGQRWNWWSAVGWALFAFGGFLGLIALGIGLARGNRDLRNPAGALIVSLLLMLVLSLAAVLFAGSLIWIAWALRRTGTIPPTPSDKPYLAG
jgi:hypothetical protein